MIRTLEEYKEMCKDENGRVTSWEAEEALEEDMQETLEDVINDLPEYRQTELINAYLDNNYRGGLYDMCELDEIVGRIYPSEIPSYFDNDFDFDDDYFIVPECGEYESGCNPWELSNVEVEDVATEILQGDIYSRFAEIVEVMEDYETITAELKQYVFEMQEEERKQKEVQKITTLLSELMEGMNEQELKQLASNIFNLYSI